MSRLYASQSVIIYKDAHYIFYVLTYLNFQISILNYIIQLFSILEQYIHFSSPH